MSCETGWLRIGLRSSTPWRSRTIIALLALVGNAWVGCAKTVFNPRSLPPGHGAIMGRIQVFQDGKEVTGKCGATLLGEGGSVTGVQLDETGWVFVSMPVGFTSIVDVSCVSFRTLKHSSRTLGFDNPGRGLTTYFGHIHLDVVPSEVAMAAHVMFGGQAMAPAMEAAERNYRQAGTSEKVSKKVDDAERTYRMRYGANPPIQVFASLAGGANFYSAPKEATVEAHGDLLTSEIKVQGVEIVWMGLCTADQQRLGVRMQRVSRTPELDNCEQLQMNIDGVEQTVPATYRREPVTVGAQETLQAELDLPTLKKIGLSKQTLLRACRLERSLPPEAAAAAHKLAVAYEKRLQHDHAETTGGESVAAPTGSVEPPR